jgi:hypothetical protein
VLVLGIGEFGTSGAFKKAPMTATGALSASRMLDSVRWAMLGRRGDRRLVEACFERKWYLDRYADVRVAMIDPVSHFLKYGAREGRNPNPLFWTEYYLSQDSTIRVAGINPLVHYLRQGWREGRDPNPLFDTDWYLLENEDVAKAGTNPLIHYLRHGAEEGRNPHPLFDTRWYCEMNLDLRGTAANPLQHFLEIGGAAGCSPHPLFDSLFYLENNPGLRASAVNPLVHYLRSGVTEGRNPNKWFDNEGYMVRYPDARQSGLNPLVHYRLHGAALGRDPSRASPPSEEQKPEQSKQEEMWNIFQSLGENCEFGLVQKHYGSTVPGLFKFAFTSLAVLVAAFRFGFRDLAAVENLSIETEYVDAEKTWGAFHVWSHCYRIRFHAGYNHITDLEKLKKAESRRLAFLVNIFIEDLHAGEKIFVFKSVPEQAGFVMEQFQVEELFAAMRAYGPVTLLWVTNAIDGHPPGSVEEISDGLMRGYIDHLAPREGILARFSCMISYSVESWLSVCTAAHALWLRKRNARSKDSAPENIGRRRMHGS